MKTLLATLALAALAGSASADSPKKSSQRPPQTETRVLHAQPGQPTHQRVGELAAFAFDRGSAKLDRKNDGAPNESLGSIAAWAEDNPDGLVVLDGHADEPGDAASNLKLSFARANAVRAELMNLGIDRDHIVIAAFGESGPRTARDRSVVAWGTRAGMKAVVARTRSMGRSIISTGLLSELDLNPQPGAVATR